MQTPASQISSDDFFVPTPFNSVTKQQIWMSQIADGHDNICHCHRPFAHLLANIFPPNHKDRDLTINQILARDLTETCHSGGDEGTSAGGAADSATAATTNIKPEGDADYPEDEIEDLLKHAGEEKERR